MLRAMFVGISGMKASQDALSSVSNNIANSQTTAYKSQKAMFEELFYQQLKSPSAPGKKYSGTNPIELGNGVKLSTVSTNFQQGTVNYTGNKTDLAIQGEGFFVIGDTTGKERMYTRAGNFMVSRDNQLITQNGQYVLGWNMDPTTGKIGTGAQIQPIKLALGQISQPIESTSMNLKGNLDITAEKGSITGYQVPSWDRLGGRHDVDLNFIKTGGNTYRYIAVPVDQFKESTSIKNAILQPSDAIAPSIVKGDYKIQTAAGATPGTVDISVLDPSGATVLTQNVSDVDQNVTLTDGTNTWFTVDYKGGGAPSTSTFTIGEAGDMSFNSVGKVTGITGSSPTGSPLISYTPKETGVPVNIDMDMTMVTGLATDNTIALDKTDGQGASSLINFTMSDGGAIEGYYDDGTIRTIGQIAVASFANPSGLSHAGSGIFMPTANSGLADVGIPGTNARGQVKAQALEMSNVDLATEFVDLLTTQKAFQANTKVIRTGDDILTSVIGLIR